MIPRLLIAVAVTLLAAGAIAQQPPTPPTPQPLEAADWEKIDRMYTTQEIQGLDVNQARSEVQRLQTEGARERRDALEDFKLGAGLGLTITRSSRSRIEDAEVIGGRIVVTEERRDFARAMFEVHQLFTTNVFSSRGRTAAREQLLRCEANAIDCPMIGMGPFVAVQTGSDNSLDTLGFGVVLGLRNDPRKDSSFNIGLGIVWDTSVRTLAGGLKPGDEFDENTPIPFKERSSMGIMLGFSFGF